MRLRRLRRWRGAATGDRLHAVRCSRRIRLIDGIVEMRMGGVGMVGTGRHRGCRMLVMIVMLMGGVCVLQGVGTGRIVVATTAGYGATHIATAIAVHAQHRRASSSTSDPADTHASPCPSTSPGGTVMMMSNAAELVAQDARDGADTGHIRLVTDALAEQAIPYLPGKDARITLLQFPYIVDHLRCGHARLGAPDGARQDGASFVVARQDLRYTAVTHAQLP